ncbi:MAG: hypothetical protein R3C05_21930 [Pirellulaceae bacterium]
MHDSRDCPNCRELPDPESMTDEAFYEWLRQCREELQVKQDRFMTHVEQGAYWHYDLEAGTLSIGSQTYRITVIGSHNAEEQTWLWAWANESFPSVVRESSSQIKQIYETTRFEVFRDVGTDASSGDAQDLSSLAIHWLEADGLFRVPTAGPTLYFAVHLSDLQKASVNGDALNEE